MDQSHLIPSLKSTTRCRCSKIKVEIREVGNKGIEVLLIEEALTQEVSVPHLVVMMTGKVVTNEGMIELILKERIESLSV
jgi:hypothetical protein